MTRLTRVFARYALAVVEGLMATRPTGVPWEFSSTSYPTDTPTTAAASPVTRGRRGSSPKRL